MSAIGDLINKDNWQIKKVVLPNGYTVESEWVGVYPPQIEEAQKEIESGAMFLVMKDRLAFERKATQHRLHLTAFGVGMLAFSAGFGVCWLAFVR